MSYLILNLNNELYKIAEDDLEKNAILINRELIQKTISITTQDFQDLQLYKKLFESSDGVNYTLKPSLGYNSDKKEIENYINYLMESIRFFLDNNKQNPMINKWQTYYDYLNSFNINTINFPLNISFEEYLYNNNVSVLNTLQLP
jgi:hypothetical protein